MEEIFMISQLMIRLSNTMKLEKYQQDRVMITLQAAYFEKNYGLIAADLSKQKSLDADLRLIQQIIFTGKASKNTAIYYILEQSKETILEFSKGTANVLLANIKLV